MATILLVEDQILFRENLAEALEDHGYAVVRASDGVEAMKCIDTYLIDLFVLDVALPGMSGLELLKNLRARPALRRVPAMFLTAYPRQDALEEAGRMGIGDFLVKSDISLKDLLERIERGLLSGFEGSTSPGGPPSSRVDPVPSRRHLRPALRRWRPQPARPQVTDLFALTMAPVSQRQLLSYLSIDPEAAKWLRRILSRGVSDPPTIESLVQHADADTTLRFLLLRAVVEGAMRSMEPFSDLRRLWKRSLMVGLLAEELAPATAFATPSQAFLAGLSLEVPWVFAIQALETEYGEVKAEAWEEGVPIRQHLADAFGTDPATLALETVRSLDIPEAAWKAVVDVMGKKSGARLWEPGVGGRVIDIVSELAHISESAWHPCTSVRSIHLDEAKWLQCRGDMMECIGRAQARAAEVFELGVFPEAIPPGETQSITISNLERTFCLHRGPDVFVPDPFEAVLRSLGTVQIVERPEQFQEPLDGVRVAVAEPGTETWNRLLETTRRVVIFHSNPLPRHVKMGPHAEIDFPVTLTALERALRPKG